MLFANFAEAVAEGRGKAQAAALRSTRRDVHARRLATGRRSERQERVAANGLRRGDFFLVEAAVRRYGEPAVLVGWSLGGYIAREYAREHPQEIERAVAERFATPLRVPVTAIYSKRDGIVAWRACIDHWSPNVQHIEVNETHVGLGFAPRVLAIIAAEVERA